MKRVGKKYLLFFLISYIIRQMTRYFCRIEYNGAGFCGWQAQNNQRSVQGEFERTLDKLFGKKIEVTASGRTDAGVHALDQCIHFDLESVVPCDRLKIALNDMLPKDIAIKKVKIVSDKFNARYAVKKKTYLYRLQCGYEKTALDGDKITQIKPMLSLEKMNEIKDIFLGKHNFKGYANAKAQVRDFEREIFDIKITQKKNQFEFRITGNGFLYNMVRIIVGSFVDFSLDKRTKEELLLAFEKQERMFAGRTMPPQGLYLEKTYYRR